MSGKSRKRKQGKVRITDFVRVTKRSLAGMLAAVVFATSILQIPVFALGDQWDEIELINDLPGARKSQGDQNSHGLEVRVSHDPMEGGREAELWVKLGFEEEATPSDAHKVTESGTEVAFATESNATESNADGMRRIIGVELWNQQNEQIHGVMEFQDMEEGSYEFQVEENGAYEIRVSYEIGDLDYLHVTPYEIWDLYEAGKEEYLSLATHAETTQEGTLVEITAAASEEGEKAGVRQIKDIVLLENPDESFVTGEVRSFEYQESERKEDTASFYLNRAGSFYIGVTYELSSESGEENRLASILIPYELEAAELTLKAAPINRRIVILPWLDENEDGVWQPEEKAYQVIGLGLPQRGIQLIGSNGQALSTDRYQVLQEDDQMVVTTSAEGTLQLVVDGIPSATGILPVSCQDQDFNPGGQSPDVQTATVEVADPEGGEFRLGLAKRPQLISDLSYHMVVGETLSLQSLCLENYSGAAPVDRYSYQFSCDNNQSVLRLMPDGTITGLNPGAVDVKITVKNTFGHENLSLLNSDSLNTITFHIAEEGKEITFTVNDTQKGKFQEGTKYVIKKPVGRPLEQVPVPKPEAGYLFAGYALGDGMIADHRVILVDGREIPAGAAIPAGSVVKEEFAKYLMVSEATKITGVFVEASTKVSFRIEDTNRGVFEETNDRHFEVEAPFGARLPVFPKIKAAEGYFFLGYEVVHASLAYKDVCLENGSIIEKGNWIPAGSVIGKDGAKDLLVSDTLSLKAIFRTKPVITGQNVKLAGDLYSSGYHREYLNLSVNDTDQRQWTLVVDDEHIKKDPGTYQVKVVAEDGTGNEFATYFYVQISSAIRNDPEQKYLPVLEGQDVTDADFKDYYGLYYEKPCEIPASPWPDTEKTNQELEKAEVSYDGSKMEIFRNGWDGWYLRAFVSDIIHPYTEERVFTTLYVFERGIPKIEISSSFLPPAMAVSEEALIGSLKEGTGSQVTINTPKEGREPNELIKLPDENVTYELLDSFQPGEKGTYRVKITATDEGMPWITPQFPAVSQSAMCTVTVDEEPSEANLVISSDIHGTEPGKTLTITRDTQSQEGILTVTQNLSKKSGRYLKIQLPNNCHMGRFPEEIYSGVEVKYGMELTAYNEYIFKIKDDISDDQITTAFPYWTNAPMAFEPYSQWLDPNLGIIPMNIGIQASTGHYQNGIPTPDSSWKRKIGDFVFDVTGSGEIERISGNRSEPEKITHQINSGELDLISIEEWSNSHGWEGRLHKVDSIRFFAPEGYGFSPLTDSDIVVGREFDGISYADVMFGKEDSLPKSAMSKLKLQLEDQSIPTGSILTSKNSVVTYRILSSDGTQILTESYATTPLVEITVKKEIRDLKDSLKVGRLTFGRFGALNNNLPWDRREIAIVQLENRGKLVQKPDGGTYYSLPSYDGNGLRARLQIPGNNQVEVDYVDIDRFSNGGEWTMVREIVIGYTDQTERVIPVSSGFVDSVRLDSEQRKNMEYIEIVFDKLSDAGVELKYYGEIAPTLLPLLPLDRRIRTESNGGFTMTRSDISWSWKSTGYGIDLIRTLPAAPKLWSNDIGSGSLLPINGFRKSIGLLSGEAGVKSGSVTSTYKFTDPDGRSRYIGELSVKENCKAEITIESNLGTVHRYEKPFGTSWSGELNPWSDPNEYIEKLTIHLTNLMKKTDTKQKDTMITLEGSYPYQELLPYVDEKGRVVVSYETSYEDNLDWVTAGSNTWSGSDSLKVGQIEQGEMTFENSPQMNPVTQSAFRGNTIEYALPRYDSLYKMSGKPMGMDRLDWKYPDVYIFLGSEDQFAFQGLVPPTVGQYRFWQYEQIQTGSGTVLRLYQSDTTDLFDGNYDALTTTDLLWGGSLPNLRFRILQGASDQTLTPIKAIWHDMGQAKKLQNEGAAMWMKLVLPEDRLVSGSPETADLVLKYENQDHFNKVQLLRSTFVGVDLTAGVNGSIGGDQVTGTGKDTFSGRMFVRTGKDPAKNYEIVATLPRKQTARGVDGENASQFELYLTGPATVTSHGGTPLKGTYRLSNSSAFVEAAQVSNWSQVEQIKFIPRTGTSVAGDTEQTLILPMKAGDHAQLGTKHAYLAAAYTSDGLTKTIPPVAYELKGYETKISVWQDVNENGRNDGEPSLDGLRWKLSKPDGTPLVSGQDYEVRQERGTYVFSTISGDAMEVELDADSLPGNYRLLPEATTESDFDKTTKKASVTTAGSTLLMGVVKLGTVSVGDVLVKEGTKAPVLLQVEGLLAGAPINRYTYEYQVDLPSHASISSQGEVTGLRQGTTGAKVSVINRFGDRMESTFQIRVIGASQSTWKVTFQAKEPDKGTFGQGNFVTIQVLNNEEVGAVPVTRAEAGYYFAGYETPRPLKASQDITLEDGSIVPAGTEILGGSILPGSQAKYLIVTGNLELDAIFRSIPVIPIVIEGNNLQIYEGEAYGQSDLNISVTGGSGSSNQIVIDDSHVDTAVAGTYQVKVSATDQGGVVTEHYLYVQVFGKTQIQGNHDMSQRAETSVESQRILDGLTASYKKPADIPGAPWTDGEKSNQQTVDTNLPLTPEMIQTDLPGKAAVGLLEVTVKAPGVIAGKEEEGSADIRRKVYVQGNPVISGEHNTLYTHMATGEDVLMEAIKTGMGNGAQKAPVEAYIDVVLTDGTKRRIPLTSENIRYQVVGFLPRTEGNYVVKITVTDAGLSQTGNLPPSEVTIERVVAVGDRIHQVTFVAGEGGSLEGGSIVKIPTVHGKPVNPPATIPQEGYEFDRWVDEAGNEIADFSSYPITSDTSIHGVFKKKTFTVRFFGKNNRLIKAETVKYKESALAPTDDAEINSSKFLGWSVDFSSITGDLDVYAKFRENSGGGDGGGETPAPPVVPPTQPEIPETLPEVPETLPEIPETLPTEPEGPQIPPVVPIPPVNPGRPVNPGGGNGGNGGNGGGNDGGPGVNEDIFADLEDNQVPLGRKEISEAVLQVLEITGIRPDLKKQLKSNTDPYLSIEKRDEKNGDVTIKTDDSSRISDDGVPAGNMEGQSDWKKCILHILLFLLALVEGIVWMFKRRKKEKGEDETEEDTPEEREE